MTDGSPPLHRVVNPPPDARHGSERLSVGFFPRGQLRHAGRMPAKLPISGEPAEIPARPGWRASLHPVHAPGPQCRSGRNECGHLVVTRRRESIGRKANNGHKASGPPGGHRHRRRQRHRPGDLRILRSGRRAGGGARPRRRCGGGGGREGRRDRGHPRCHRCGGLRRLGGAGGRPARPTVHPGSARQPISPPACRWPNWPKRCGSGPCKSISAAISTWPSTASRR